MPKREAVPRYLGLLLVSAAALAYQVGLTRVFTISQWYHYAFLSVSLAFLGFGVSGSIMTAGRRRWQQLAGPSFLSFLAVLFGGCTLGGYLIANHLPFDPFRLVLERRQFLYLFLQYAALLSGFFFAGFITGWILSCYPEESSRLYFTSLLGSGLGALLTLPVLSRMGETGLMLLIPPVAFLAALFFIRAPAPPASTGTGAARRRKQLTVLACLGLLAATGVFFKQPAVLKSRFSEYKAFSQIMQFSGSRLLETRHNSYSRVDVVTSPLIHYAPGLSHLYPGEIPSQPGIFLDGDNMTALTRTTPAEMEITGYLLTALPYAVRKPGRVLVLNPRGGLDVLTALQWGAESVTVIEDNPLVTTVLRNDREQTALLRQEVRVLNLHPRSYLAGTGKTYDFIQFSLTDGFNAVTAGAYSLHENYLLTVEGIHTALQRLSPGGLLVLSRWLQMPPSEGGKLWATVLAALERAGVDHPEKCLAAARDWRQVIVLVKKEDFSPPEIRRLREYTAARAFDIVFFPGMPEEEANRYNVLPEPVYYRLFTELLTGNRSRFYREYAFDIRPPVDDRPFFFHFFRWTQVPSVLRNLGVTWQPFGGDGFLVVLLYLVVAVVLGILLVFLPLRRKTGGRLHGGGGVLLYFSLLGLGFLFIEVPLMHQFILFLDHPTQSFAFVLTGLLVYSGLGSLYSGRLQPRHGRVVLGILAFIVLLYAAFLPPFIRFFAGQTLTVRVFLTLFALSPLSLMGMPFPLGLRFLAGNRPELIPWAWAVNGCASVLASILSILAALGRGYGFVLLLAGISYLLAAVFYRLPRAREGTD